jgi:hypothetical protein
MKWVYGEEGMGRDFFSSFNCRHGCRDFKKEGLRVFVTRVQG